jgi:uncharacterized damage-inducible protein DinB
MDAGIEFAPLIAYTEQENAGWKKFFEQHPNALDLPCDVAGAGTVHELMFHTLAVHLMFGNLLLGLPRPDFKTLPHGTIQELFAVGDEGIAKTRKFLASASEADWGAVVPLGFRDLQASRRKMLMQSILHGVHHRAQLATFLRQNGFKQDWIHDFIVSGVMK